jgi:hypothetical protein
VKETFWLTKLPLIGCVKLKAKLAAPAGTDTGVKPGVMLTAPAVLTHVTPQVTSKVSDGLIEDPPIIRTTALTLVESGLATVTVQS